MGSWHPQLTPFSAEGGALISRFAQACSGDFGPDECTTFLLPSCDFGGSDQKRYDSDEAIPLMQHLAATDSRKTMPVLAAMRRGPALDNRWMSYDNMVDFMKRSGHSCNGVLLRERWQCLTPMWVQSSLTSNTVFDTGEPMYIGYPSANRAVASASAEPRRVPGLPAISIDPGHSTGHLWLCLCGLCTQSPPSALSLHPWPGACRCGLVVAACGACGLG